VEAVAAAHVFVADLAAPELTAEDAHHLSRVLRLRPGEGVTASDGVGGWRLCEWDGSALRAQGDVEREPARAPVITVGFVPTKGERPEWAVQKLTEAGTDRILLLSSARSVVRWDGERADRHLERLRRVAREAAGQSRQVWLPTVEGPVAFADALAASGPVALAERGGAPPSLRRPTVFVGPEGGWSDDELAAVEHFVGLGPSVLRAETATVAAGLLLAALRHAVVEEPPAGEANELR
jgi:16S rRNA (uracil1498-N3)-methyltransferase